MRRNALPKALAALALTLTGCAGAPSPAVVQAPGSAPQALGGPVDESDERIPVGLWNQVEIECSGPQPSEPVRELEFKAPDRFSVTFLPFESYQDYWGQVDFDPVAGRLTLTVEGGNQEPENAILSGPARLEDGGRRLVLEGFNLGNAHHYNSGWPCRYVFAR
jgi:hypothetical protein